MHGTPSDGRCGVLQCEMCIRDREYLADAVYKGGLQALKRTASTYYEIGLFKCECAMNIGKWMDIRKNESPSFNYANSASSDHRFR